MAGEKLVFVRTPDLVRVPELTGLARAPDVMEKGMAESSAAYKPQEADAQHPMIGALKGLLWIDPTLDLTKPALDPDQWERILNDKYGKDERGT